MSAPHLPAHRQETGFPRYLRHSTSARLMDNRNVELRRRGPGKGPARFFPRTPHQLRGWQLAWTYPGHEAGFLIQAGKRRRRFGTFNNRHSPEEVAQHIDAVGSWSSRTGFQVRRHEQPGAEQHDTEARSSISGFSVSYINGDPRPEVVGLQMKRGGPTFTAMTSPRPRSDRDVTSNGVPPLGTPSGPTPYAIRALAQSVLPSVYARRTSGRWKARDVQLRPAGSTITTAKFPDQQLPAALFVPGAPGLSGG